MYHRKHAGRLMLAALAAAVLLAGVPGAQAAKNGFMKADGHTFWYQDGKPVKSRWVTVSGKKYYFNKKGYMLTGKVKTKKVMYYFGANGVFSHSIDLTKKMICLTYDDGPSVSTPIVLNALKKAGGRATFFVVGNRVNTYKKYVKQACDQGCEIGNHTWNHVNLSSKSASEIRNQIAKTNNAVKKVTGTTPKIMRPPYGAASTRAANSIGMPLILWSDDTLDWKTRSTSATVNYIKRHAQDGDIILMHDLHRPTALAAKQIVPWLVKQGYQLVTVSEMADCRGVLKKGAKYYSFRK